MTLVVGSSFPPAIPYFPPSTSVSSLSPSLLKMALRLNSLIALVRHARARSLYGLLVLMVVYLLNQMDRFILGIASKEIGRDLHFAQFACFPNTSSPPPDNTSCVGACTSFKNESQWVPAV